MNNKSSQLDNGNGPLVQDEGNFSFVDLLDNLFYFRWHFLTTFIFVTVIAVLYAVMATPIYSADTLIQVEERKGTSLGALSQVANALGAQQSPILGEIEILRSRSVVGKAVDNLKANIEVQVDNRLPIVGGWLSRILARDSDGLTKPLWEGNTFAWGGEQLKLEELSVPSEYYGVPLFLVIGKSKSWELRDRSDNVLAKGDGTNALVTSRMGALRIDISSIRARAGTRFRVIVHSIQSRVIQILDKLVALETKRQSSIIRVAYENPNSAFSAAMLNEISDVYVAQNIGRRSEEAELSLHFLNDELPKLRVRLDASEKALNDFRSKSKTMDITSEIRELLAKSTAIEKSHLELDLKRREFSERYDAAHPFMKALNAQLEGVSSEAADVTKQITRLPLVEQDYIRLARDVQVNNQLYVSLLNNAQQLQIAKAGTTGNVAIVDRAVVPERPARPRKSLIAAIGALTGLVFGFLLCQVLALVSRVVRDPKKLELATGLPTLAVIPLDEEQLIIAATPATDAKVFLLAKERPNASSVEALRSLRTSMFFILSEKQRSKVVLITSAVPAQGKSFLAVNLAYLVAATGKKVLLIEADIRLATGRNYISIGKNVQGLSSVLKDNVDPEEVIQREVFENMDYLPAGPTVRNPGDLLATDAMSELTAALAEKYDYVVIDSPPLLPVHDARSLGKSADVTFFVARQDSVSLSEVHDAIDVFDKSGNRFDGVIFNGFIPSSIKYGYGYGYGYAKYKKYRGYGRRYGVYGGYRSYGRYGGYGESDKT